MITYKEFNILQYIDQIKEILKDEGWLAYLKDDDKLIRAFNNSLYIFGAFDGEKLVGYIRDVGDGEHILLVQDLIVRKDFQRKGIGTFLFKNSLDKYADCRMFQVVTDIEDPIANYFYSSFGLKKLEKGNMVSYFR